MNAPMEEYSLCHGAFGLMDFMLEGSRYRRSARGVSAVRRVASCLAEEVCNSGFRCDVATSALAVPGLFLGLAGVGYVGLRLLNTNVPSVLSLEPPAVLPSRLAR